jgi:hypothetical protein
MEGRENVVKEEQMHTVRFMSHLLLQVQKKDFSSLSLVLRTAPRASFFVCLSDIGMDEWMVPWSGMMFDTPFFFSH